MWIQIQSDEFERLLKSKNYIAIDQYLDYQTGNCIYLKYIR